MVKNWLVNAGDAGSISGSGRSLGEGNGYPLQYSCLGNPMDREACSPQLEKRKLAPCKEDPAQSKIINKKQKQAIKEIKCHRIGKRD